MIMKPWVWCMSNERVKRRLQDEVRCVRQNTPLDEPTDREALQVRK